MDSPIPGRSREPPSPRLAPSEIREEIATIGEQQRETLALLRQLIEMLLPKVDPDKPKLEDLIAVLVGQQTRMLMLLKQIGANTSELLDHLAPEARGKPNGQRAGNGGARS